MSEAPELRLLGTSYRVAGLAEREEIIASGQDALRELRESVEAFMLTTCNRVEFYYISEREAFPPALRGHSNVMYRKEGAEAFLHLVRVASGLDSFVPGEEGILYQIRGQLRAQEREAGLGRLSQVIGQAVSIARKFRASERINGKEVVSALMGEALRRVRGRSRAAIVGSGRTAKLAYLSIRGNFEEVYVVSRRRLMPGEFTGALTARLEELNARLGDFDLIVSATNTEVNRYLISGGASSPRRDALLIDLSVPRTISPSLKGQAELWDMDDAVKLIDGSAGGESIREAEKRLRELSLPAYIRIKYRKLSPELSSLGSILDDLIEEEVREALKRAGGEGLEAVMRKLAERSLRKALAYVFMPPRSEEELKAKLDAVRALLEGIRREGEDEN